MPARSGIRSIGISSERARYHATRQNLHIQKNTPHEKLYDLVDVVLAEQESSRPRQSFTYTGKTLSDDEWRRMLSTDEQTALNNWLKDPATCYEIEGVRRRLIYDDLPDKIQRYNYPETLHSQLIDTIRKQGPGIASVEQWKNTIKNLLSSGIKQDELNWSGIMNYLRQYEDPATRLDKEEILSAIDFSSIRMELINELKLNEGEASNHTRYQYISLTGGEDYREWLLSLPDYPMSYFSPHYTERNVLLHIRSKTRFDEQDRKLLFLEEIQSDWHQRTIKNHNTRTFVSKPPAPFKTDWASLALKLMLIHATREGYDGLSWANGEVQTTHYQRDITAVKRLYDKTIPQTLVKLSRRWNGMIDETTIATELSSLSVSRYRSQWQVKDRSGDVVEVVDTQAEAMAIVQQHSEPATLQMPVFVLPEGMGEYVELNGFSLFGESI